VITNATDSPNYVSCHLTLFDYDQEQTRQVFEGFVEGLYNNPPADCSLCSKLGLAAGTLQSNFITLENKRSQWVDIQAVFKLDFFTQVKRLLDLLVLFATTAISIDSFVKSKEVMTLLEIFVKRMDSSYFYQMQMNTLDNFTHLMIIWSLAPGASCKGLGVRAGSTVKRLFSVSFEVILKA
jgi:hypothetical protein